VQQPTSRFASDNIAEALQAQNSPDTDPRPLTTAGKSPTTSAYEDEVAALRAHLRATPRHTIDGLVQLYFDTVHVDFPLFNRTVFQETYEQYLFTTRAFSAPDDGWVMCLHLMIAFGCFLHRKDESHETVPLSRLRSRCWNVTWVALPRILMTSTVSNVQALFLMAHFYHNCNDRNAAWTLIGCATRIAVALGLHRSEVNQTFRMVERETRKRLWCTLFAYEQFLCLSLGRPAAIDNRDILVEAPSDETVIPGSGPPGCARVMVELQLLASRMREMMRPIHRTAASPSDVSHADPKALLDLLQAWKESVPSYLSLPSFTIDSGLRQLHAQLEDASSRYSSVDLRAIAMVHINYHSLVVLVTRPYLLMVISVNWKSGYTGPDPWEENHTADEGCASARGVARLAQSCVSSACQMAGLLLLLDNGKALNGLTGLDIFYAYSAAMVLLLRLLWSSSADCNEQILSLEERRRNPVSDLASSMRNLLNNTDKCLTMQRLATVAENFADAVRATASAPKARSTIPVHSHRGSSGTHHKVYLTGHTGGNVHESPEAKSQGPVFLPDARPVDDSFTASDSIYSSFTQPRWPDFQFWQDSFQAATLDWSNFEQFLGNFDVPS
jgi:hypothetical protein